MRGTPPAQFVDGAAWKDERSPRLRRVAKALASGEDFVPDWPTEYDVQEIMHVLVVRDDTRRNMVILDCETCPFDRRAAQRWTRVQKCLDATLAYDFDSGNNGAVTWCTKRHVDASNPRDW